MSSDYGKICCLWLALCVGAGSWAKPAADEKQVHLRRVLKAIGEIKRGVTFDEPEAVDSYFGFLDDRAFLRAYPKARSVLGNLKEVFRTINDKERNPELRPQKLAEALDEASRSLNKISEESEADIVLGVPAGSPFTAKPAVDLRKHQEKSQNEGPPPHRRGGGL